MRSVMPRRTHLLSLILLLGATVALAMPTTPATHDITPDNTTDNLEHPSLLAQRQHTAAHQQLIGTWRANIGNTQIALTLEPDQQFALNGQTGTYQRQPGALVLDFDGPPPYTRTYNYQFVNQQLELSQGDLEEPVLFIRQFSPIRYLAQLFDTEVDEVGQRLNRIVFIIIIVMVARLAIALIRAAIHALIFSEFGPLRLVYRNRKNRAQTIYSIALNLVKYFIYFTALGMILAELGVNYMTYIASLSVIGLAIGFGSQGLVQDMVTGFFIIFEGQFDVGDMVEISGQAGYVTELGLRMTKIRNYLGQTVVIPNRNIAILGNYARGAQRAYVDVQINPDDAPKATIAMQQLADQLLKQFQGVALGPVKITGPIPHPTGQHFLRLHLSIWPNQTWLIDQQLMPRLRELLSRENITIVNDRVSAFYHARQAMPVNTWTSRLPWRHRKNPPQPPQPAK